MWLRLIFLLLVLPVLGLAACGGGGGGDGDGDGDGDGGAEATDSTAAGLDPGTEYQLVVETTKGSFTIALDQNLAPNTAKSLVELARKGFFDGTSFHRVVPGFVIQGGDPTGTGTGGPGYSTVDAPPSDAVYTKGVVAMAKTPAEAPGTAGSQFFVVTGADIGLPAEYAIVGRVTEGMETVQAIDALGVGDGPPSEPVTIERMTVRES
jgi:cyclophilin family peptidyl-prolyl cis-trans isomerase